MKHAVRYSLIAVIALAGVLPAAWGNAAPFRLSQLYTASVPVAQQNASDLQPALRQALAKVLVRVTGQADADQMPGAKAVLDQASNLVSQYGYQSGDQGTELQATFSRQALNQAIRKNNLPLWGRERPRTLVLLVIYGNGGRKLVHSGQAGQLANGLLQGARDRGLPLMFPRQGASGGNALSAADVTGGFRDRIQQAAQHYGTRQVAFGQIEPGSGGWQGSMTLLSNGHTQAQWQVSGNSQEDVLTALANRIANTYAKRYAVAANSQSTGTTLVDVDNINSVADYARVSRYLNSLTAVSNVEVELVRGHMARFRVASDSGREYLSRAIALSPKFHRVSAASLPSGGGSVQGQPANTQDMNAQQQSSTGSGTGAAAAGNGGSPQPAPLHYRYQP